MIESGRYKWPEDFPEGIPGENTVPASGKVYRLVSSIPPTEEDFKMHKIDNPRYNYKRDDEDKAYGVSFWSILEKCLEAKKKYAAPEQFGNKRIAYGNLNPDLGVIPKEPSKNGHLTLWKQIDAQPHLYVCNEETLS